MTDISNLPNEDFCLKLEYKISKFFTTKSETKHNNYWCDGIIPEKIEKLGKGFWLIGKMFFGLSGQEHWDFRFRLTGINSKESVVDYNVLLNKCVGDKWIQYYPERKYCEILPK